MARIRSVKPEFWTDRKTARLSRDARLLYIALWNQADEHGRMHGDARYVKGHCLPYDDDLNLADVDRLLDELARHGRLVRYEVDGDPYLHLPKLSGHQRLEPHKSASRLPAPPDNDLPGGPQTHDDDPPGKSAQVSDERAPIAVQQVAGCMGQVAGGRGQDSPPAAGDDDGESEGQYVNRLAKTYTDLIPLSNFPAVAGVVRKAVRIGTYSEQQITHALLTLADEKRPVTTDALRIALDGPPTGKSTRVSEQDQMLRGWYEQAIAGQMPELGA